MALRSLWGQCAPHAVLAGTLSGHKHGYGLRTSLLYGRHPGPGTPCTVPSIFVRMVHYPICLSTPDQLDSPWGVCISWRLNLVC